MINILLTQQIVGGAWGRGRCKPALHMAQMEGERPLVLREKTDWPN